jgi:hypothetical protein
MTSDEIDDLAGNTETPVMKMDGYDDCVIGLARIFNGSPFLVYDHEKIIQKLMKDGMTREEANEFHEFNQVGAWVGDGTPAFLIKTP